MIVKMQSSMETKQVEDSKPRGPQHRSHLKSERLPVWELVFYAVLHVGLFGYVLIELYHYSRDKHHILSSNDLIKPGWLGGLTQDDTDFEWRFWKEILDRSFLINLILYFTVCRTVEYFAPQFREEVMLISSLLFLFNFLTWIINGLLLIFAAVMFLASKTRNIVVVWCISIVILLGVNLDVSIETWRDLLTRREVNHLIFFSNLILLKFISFGCECCKPEELPVDPNTGKRQDTFMNFMSYSFYLPLFLIGPIYTYSQFRQDMNSPVVPLHKKPLRQILYELLHYTFWMFFLEVCMHFLHFQAFVKRRALLLYAPYSVLAGATLLSPFFFLIKYLPLYGYPRIFALFDGIQSPLAPTCFIGTPTFKDLWRYFDSGLHMFILKYIYLPLGGSRKGFLMQVFASCLTFIFMYIWHGAYYHLGFWALLNVTGLLLEGVIDGIAQRGLIQKVNEHLPVWAVQRIMGIIYAFNMIAIFSANLVFIHGTANTRIMADRLLFSVFSGKWRPFTGVFLYFYTAMQFTMEAHAKWGKTYLCRKEYYVYQAKEHVKTS